MGYISDRLLGNFRVDDPSEAPGFFDLPEDVPLQYDSAAFLFRLRPILLKLQGYETPLDAEDKVRDAQVLKHLSNEDPSPWKMSLQGLYEIFFKPRFLLHKIHPTGSCRPTTSWKRRFRKS